MTAPTPRTAVTPDVLVRDGAVVASGGGSGDHTNGNTVASPGPFKTLIVVANGGMSSTDVTIRAHNNGVDAAGVAQSGDYQPFAAAAAGDLVVTVDGGDTALFWLETSDRFTQSDGSLSIDLSSDTSVDISAYQLPQIAR